MTGSLLTLLPVALISRYRQQRDWLTLLRQGGHGRRAAARRRGWRRGRGLNALLLTLTGGLTLAPTCSVFWHYLTSTVWRPLGRRRWRSRLTGAGGILSGICCYSPLACGCSLACPPSSPALPVLSGAADYRPRPALRLAGALIATLMNAIALIASQTGTITRSIYCFPAGTEPHRAAVGGGIQRLRELNQSLQSELARNRRLAERLLETEESVRRDVARELHDDIGQTITAIRTRPGSYRLAPDNASVRQSGQLIEQLSLGVYDSVRRLPGRLRPRQLDDLPLEQAVRSLMREMELEDRGIVSHLDWRINEAD